MQQMTRQNSGVGASTFAETDYVCGSGNSVNDNDDNVNIGSNEDVEDSALMRYREQSQEKSNNNLIKSKNSQGSVKNSMVFSNNQSITSSRHLKEREKSFEYIL